MGSLAVDRVASAWLIRRFVDPEARFLWLDRPEDCPAEALGFDENQANELIVADGLLTGEVGYPILGQQAKLEALRRIAARLGISHSEALAVGDGANDLAMLRAAGMGVALHAKPQVQAEARFRVNHGDLTALLYLQGYAKRSFAT